MREIFIILNFAIKVLERIPTASMSVKMKLIDKRDQYRDELSKEKHLRNDEIIDSLRDEILELSEYAIDLLSSQESFNGTSPNDRN